MRGLGIIIFLLVSQICLSQELKQGYYPDGKIRYKGYFIDDKPVGELLRYYPEGSIQAKMNHKGDTVEAVLYSKDGGYTMSGRYIRQKKTGVWEYQKGQELLASEEYLNGLLSGESRHYGKNGVLLEQKLWKAGQVDGIWKLYYEDGKLRMRAFYQAGKLNGELASYSREGKLRSEGIYKNDLKEGTWKFYDEEGQLVKEQVYRSGVLENATEHELEESRRLDALINATKKIPDPAVFVDDPEAYMRLMGM